MGEKITLDDKEYDTKNLSEAGKTQLKALQFVFGRVQELNNQQALLQRAKNSYVNSLKQEMLSKKAGFLFEDN